MRRNIRAALRYRPLLRRRLTARIRAGGIGAGAAGAGFCLRLLFVLVTDSAVHRLA